MERAKIKIPLRTLHPLENNGFNILYRHCLKWCGIAAITHHILLSAGSIILTNNFKNDKYFLCVKINDAFWKRKSFANRSLLQIQMQNDCDSFKGCKLLKFINLIG